MILCDLLLGIHYEVLVLLLLRPLDYFRSSLSLMMVAESSRRWLRPKIATLQFGVLLLLHVLLKVGLQGLGWLGWHDRKRLLIATTRSTSALIASRNLLTLHLLLIQHALG